MRGSGSERRRAVRTAASGMLEYTLSLLDSSRLRRIHSSGETANISDGGLSFIADVRLEPGYILFLRFAGDPTPYAAIVRWATEQDNGKFAVGAMLCK